MNRHALAFAATLAVLPVASFADGFAFDPAHTEVRIYWTHAGFSEQSAEFHTIEGGVTFSPDALDTTKADVTVKVDSIDSGFEALDTHLKSDDFFNAESFPDIRFVSTGVEQTGEHTAKMTGDLTIRDVTKPVTLDVTVVNYGEHPVGAFYDYYKGQWLGARAETVVKRSDWGIDTFIPVGSDEIRVVISTEMKAQ